MMLTDTKETHVKNVTDRFNRMTVQVIWCIHEKFEDLYNDCAALSVVNEDVTTTTYTTIYLSRLSRTLKTHILSRSKIIQSIPRKFLSRMYSNSADVSAQQADLPVLCVSHTRHGKPYVLLFS
jgi:hypothetical protein